MIRLTPGAIKLALDDAVKHGAKGIWYRDVVRPRILQTPPIEDTSDKQCEIHVLTSAGDWINLLWTLKSFYAVSGRRYALCIHEDGTLDAPALGHLARHFPGARIIRRADADAMAEQKLRDFPRSLDFRRTNLLAPKVFDFLAFLESDRMAVFDSDLLFFDEPSAYLGRVEDPAYMLNTFNADKADAYTVDRHAVRDLIGHELVGCFNSGLGLAHRRSMRLEWIEEFLSLPGILDGHFWRIEQTLYALCSSRFGVELLPQEYALSFQPGIDGRPFRHYVGGIRHLMYSEGMVHLSEHGLLSGTLSAARSQRRK
jgi:hypothetical protein